MRNSKKILSRSPVQNTNFLISRDQFDYFDRALKKEPVYNFIHLTNRPIRKLLFAFRHYSDLSDYFTSISTVPTQYSIFISWFRQKLLLFPTTDYVTYAFTITMTSRWSHSPDCSSCMAVLRH